MSIVYSEPGIFNVVEDWVSVTGPYVGLLAGDPTKGAQNTQVLRGIIELAQAFTAAGKCPNSPFGATILFPGHSVVPPPGPGGPDAGSVYHFQVPAGDTAVVTINCNWPLRFLGTGNVN